MTSEKNRKTLVAGNDLQQKLDLGPNPAAGPFQHSYQTQIYTALDPGVGNHISKGFKSTDLIPFFIHDRRQVSLSGRVTATEASNARLIEIEGRTATLTQKAANITVRSGKNKGAEIFRHLGEREEVILDALKYIASRSPTNFGVYQGEACLKFSASQIRSVIDNSYNYQEILEALDVLHGSDTELKMHVLDENKVIKPLKSSLLPILVTAEDPETHDMFDGGASTSSLMCTFHPLITRDLANLNFRQINYLRIRMRRSSIAKHIEKRLSHNYTQASEKFPYSIHASSILRSAGVPYDPEKSTDTNFKTMFRALRELTVPDGINFDDLKEEDKDIYILLSVEIKAIFVESLLKRRRIVDYKLTMYPTPRFVQQQIEANVASLKDEARMDMAKELNLVPEGIRLMKISDIPDRKTPNKESS